MKLLDKAAVCKVSGGLMDDIQSGAQWGSNVGLLGGVIAGVKASGFALATYEYVPFAGWCLVSAGSGSVPGLLAYGAAGALAGFWGGAVIGGALVVGSKIHNKAVDMLYS